MPDFVSILIKWNAFPFGCPLFEAAVPSSIGYSKRFLLIAPSTMAERPLYSCSAVATLPVVPDGEKVFVVDHITAEFI